MRKKLTWVVHHPRYRTLAVTAWMGTLLVLPLQVGELLISSPQVLAQPASAQLSEAQIKQLAAAITVKVIAGENGGSGILIRKEAQKAGYLYTVVTNQHVLEPGKAAQIQTGDGKKYPATLLKGVNFRGKDIALLQFSTNANYTVSSLGNLSTVTVNEPIYSAGFPFEKKANQNPFVFKSGKVLLVPERAFKEGYQIGYDNTVEKGMSGGPILNRRGQVIGINGIHAYPLWGNPYVYEDGSQPTAALKDLMSRYSWGIPIQTFAQLAPQYTSKESLPTGKTPVASKLPPIANDVSNIAKEITVLIDVPSMPQCSGSGVIISKQGNTYSVLSAEHVIRGSQKCDRTQLEIVTSDGKRYPIQVNDRNVRSLPDSDLALLQFNSDQNYRTATLANYNITGYDGFIFVSGWQDTKAKNPALQHKFTAGNVVSKQLGSSILAKNSLSSSYGYGMIYTNLTEQGMSGGPILDIRGRVIGIHGRSEVESVKDQAGKNRLITLGFSLGVPISDFINWSKSAGILSASKVETTIAPALTQPESDAILQSLLQPVKPQNNADAIDWVNYGWELIRTSTSKTNTSESIQSFDKAIQLRPNFYQAWYLRGFVYMTQNNYQESLKSFDKSVQIEPNFSTAWRWRGMILANLNKYQEALACFEQLAKLDPGDSGAQTFRSIMLIGLQRFPEALEIAEKSLKQYPNSWNYFARGIARFGTKDQKGALADLNEAIRLNPEAIEDTAYSVRATIRYAQGDIQGALTDYNEAIRLNPQKAEPILSRAAIHLQQKDYKSAVVDLNEAIRLKPEYREAFELRGTLYFLQNKHQEAVKDLTQAIRLNSQNPDVYSIRGGAWLQLKDKKAASLDFQKAADLYKQQGNNERYQQVLQAIKSLN
ncbi:serine protease [Calothrix sp. PCC 6303]|uniref:serine protease n=1 Tax=Calothrix sp. PCC 6303 TaxID=1170562 RepID=UPI0002A022CB|nr:serine protease [Calothrix sp. PCC 6303]AFZ02622.1 Tetratricopeptide TPR_2 repeat-containing protein [Calothrix sp. PCC 6303]